MRKYFFPHRIIIDLFLQRRVPSDFIPALQRKTVWFTKQTGTNDFMTPTIYLESLQDKIVQEIMLLKRNTSPEQLLLRTAKSF